MELRLSPSTSISTRTSKGRSRLALIVIDEDGRRYGLSTKHALRCEQDGLIYEQKTGMLIGKYTDFSVAGQNRSGNWPEFSESIGAFQIGSDAQNNPIAASNFKVKSTADAWQLVGKRGFRLGENGLRVPVRIDSVGGSVSFKDPFRGTAQSMRNVIELIPEDNRVPLEPGEGGAVIVDDDWRAVGILIAASQDVHFAAPLGPYLQSHRLQVLGGSPDLGAATIGDEDLGEYLLAEVRQTKWGVEKMKRDLSHENNLFNDPAGNEVPAHLLSRLDSLP